MKSGRNRYAFLNSEVKDMLTSLYNHQKPHDSYSPIERAIETEKSQMSSPEQSMNDNVADKR